MKHLKPGIMAVALALCAAALFSCFALAEEAEPVFATETVTQPLDLPSGDLFYRYMLRKGSGIRPRGTLAGDTLTGNDAVVYGIVKPGIEAVAAGTQSTTSFTVTLGDLGIESNGTRSKESWSAADLGVTTLKGNDGNINAETWTALFDQVLRVDTYTLMRALLYDCPFDLYWFDKTDGKGMQTGLSHGFATVGGVEKLFLGNNALAFKFSVAAAYAGTADFTTDEARIARANAAAANARSFVASCSGMSDYEKLTAYRDKICDEVTYDHDAANSSTPYGDPWQLVSVFDGDSGTNVVCEGYSKAFQYLCDLSHFAGSVQCYSVSGTMSGGSGAGAHMWNLVNMSDGVSYLVDVTNCDSGSAGYPDKLFMKGATLTDAPPHPYYVNVGTANDPHRINYSYDDGILARWRTAILTPSAIDYTSVDLAFATVTLTPNSAYFTEQAIEPTVAVVFGGRTLAEGIDYNVAFADNIRVGIASVTVSAVDGGNFIGSQTVTFPIFERVWTIPKMPENGSGWAVPPADLTALDAGALAGTAFDVVDLTATRCEAIGAQAFAGMDALKAVLAPATLTRLAADAFDGISLWKVTLCFPNGVNPDLAIDGYNGEDVSALNRLKAWAFESGVFLELDSHENP